MKNKEEFYKDMCATMFIALAVFAAVMTGLSFAEQAITSLFKGRLINVLIDALIVAFDGFFLYFLVVTRNDEDSLHEYLKKAFDTSFEDMSNEKTEPESNQETAKPKRKGRPKKKVE